MFGPQNLYTFTDLKSRSASAQNPTGDKGGTLVDRHHCVEEIKTGESITLLDVDGPGMVRNIWLTVGNRDPHSLRNYIIRIYWDNSEYPSVEAPMGDFFGLAHGRGAHFSTPLLGVSEGKGFWTYFQMPFSKHCRITFENDRKPSEESDKVNIFYQIMYTLGDKVTDDMGRFHVNFRRDIPPIGENHTIMETSDTPGVYVGTNLSTLPLTPGTFREGNFKFFIDGDGEMPTIAGTGWSDWFLSAWGLGEHQSPYAGSNYQVLHPEMKNKYFCNSYRFHFLDPVYFQNDLRVEHSQIGMTEGDFKWEEVTETSNRSDDWATTAYWYQRLTDVPFPELPGREVRSRSIDITDWEMEAREKQQALTAERNLKQMKNLDSGG